MSQRKRALSGIPVLQQAQGRPERGGGMATERRLAGAREIPLDQVVPDARQPRQDWAHGEGARRLDELTASVREFGILQPLLVYEDGALEDGRQRYRVIAGARRRAAAERAGLAMVPVVVRDLTDRLRFEQLQENLQRQDLSPLDEARAFQELLELGGLTAQALAVRLCVSGQHVRDRLRLLADQVLADAVERRQIAASVAREIMKLPDEEMLAFRERVLEGQHLQATDVATARARLAAAGVVNERRKAPRAAVNAVQRAEEPEGARQDQTLFDPGATGMATAIAPPPGEPNPPLAGTSSAHGHPQPAGAAGAPPTPGEQIRALLAGRVPAERRLVEALLAIGMVQGWSCGEMWRRIQEQQG